eukprot:TRINITY_DN1063_c0_g1_i1.p1 TRINITY_DN1063_c0_g1~~TRINITY_DN1063_c0_g1_i1.p1  ORF type:complete len:363 (-),score=105.04 TRINITY_DN1063_c0_g1_i1:98-1186(-)
MSQKARCTLRSIETLHLTDAVELPLFAAVLHSLALAADSASSLNTINKNFSSSNNPNAHTVSEPKLENRENEEAQKRANASLSLLMPFKSSAVKEKEKIIAMVASKKAGNITQYSTPQTALTPSANGTNERISSGDSIALSSISASSSSTPSSDIYTPSASSDSSITTSAPASTTSAKHSLPFAKSPLEPTVFDASSIPTISLTNYLQRIMRFANSSRVGVCFTSICLICYLRRIKEKHPEFCFTMFNAHRLIITTTVVVHKFFSDYYYRNSFYAQIGGIKAKEMNYLEAEMLGMLDFRLYIDEEEFLNTLDSVRQSSAYKNIFSVKIPKQLTPATTAKPEKEKTVETEDDISPPERPNSPF